MGNAASEKLLSKLAKLYESDNDSIHFLWDCREKTVETLGGSFVFPRDTGNPFFYMQKSGLIDPAYESFYQVFSSKLDEAVIGGIAEQSLCADIRMKLSEADEFRMCHIYLNLLKDDEGRVTDVHANIRPFTKQEVFDHEVLSVFTSDKNPAIFSKKCAEVMARGREGHIAYIQFDVERFKLINDTYSTERGDELLRFFNDSMKVLCTEKQPFCRLTADVFMVVTEFEERYELLRFVNMLESRLSFYKGMEYRLIFGIYIVDDLKLATRRCGDNAAMARQSIKGNAMENISFYENKLINVLHKTQDIEENMHKAVVNGDFVMFLQPKYCISTRKIIGAEALARWIHPERGMISPAEFIPVFEQNGFIIKLDRIIWELACKKLRYWLDCGIKPVPISVNISREYLANTDIVAIISELVAKYKIPKELLELEITESVENNNVRDVVKKFKDCGFTMLMDDFGSGYSSLNMLKSTQFDVLKIDRGFFSEFMESDRGRKIISHTISMSQDIGLDIIAEGVETDEQADFLSGCGCDAAQGFLYCRPVPEAEFDKMLLAQQL
ncbi:MAG: GGDEF domain-containing protein [Oscillospiraceae bacterium]|nr:GGDEF domain-containing protein [Oscillospiraceae bacterium]